MGKSAENPVEFEGVVLAAGFSSRTGPGLFKMELPFRGKTLLENTIASLLPVCSRVMVVGGYQFERVRAIVEPYPNVEPVANPNYPAGMFTSVRAGVARVKAQWFFITPGDYPLIEAATCQALLEARDAHPAARVFIPVYGGRKGHPVLMARSLVPALLMEPEHSNLRAFINRNGFIPVEVSDNGILADIDTMEDYWSLLENLKLPEK